jgi:hypothetical protein
MSIQMITSKRTMFNSSHLDLLVSTPGETRLIQDREGRLYAMNPQSRPPGAPKLLMVFDMSSGILEMWNHTYRRNESFIDLTETVTLSCELQTNLKADD